MRGLLRFAATRIGVQTYERLLAHSVLKDTFNGLAGVPVYDSREDSWCAHIANPAQSHKKITYIEFGVHAGYSIKFIASKNTNPHSVFIGLDSFEGLPEDWGVLKRGYFDLNGEIPKADDTRIKFIKGWFQNTWEQLLEIIPSDGDLIVHYDADLYSSTLFALTKIDSLRRAYTAIFDEFAGHEARALHNYQQSYNPKVSFESQTIAHGYPVHVMCRISPASCQ
jgi:hypothetical protein